MKRNGVDAPGPERGLPDAAEPTPPGQLLMAMLVVYGLMTAGGYGWLAWRERTIAIGTWALGTHGALVAAAVGTGTGVAFFALARLLVRYARPFAALDGKLAALIGPLADRDAIALSVVSGAAEEFFFRCACQDALGWVGATLLFALGHLGGRGLYLWCLQAACFGFVLGGLVQAGFGVLSAATAHALFNYLWLQRLTPQ